MEGVQLSICFTTSIIALVFYGIFPPGIFLGQVFNLVLDYKYKYSQLKSNSVQVKYKNFQNAYT